MLGVCTPAVQQCSRCLIRGAETIRQGLRPIKNSALPTTTIMALAWSVTATLIGGAAAAVAVAFHSQQRSFIGSMSAFCCALNKVTVMGMNAHASASNVVAAQPISARYR